jgi:hypothetical protein
MTTDVISKIDCSPKDTQDWNWVVGEESQQPKPTQNFFKDLHF